MVTKVDRSKYSWGCDGMHVENKSIFIGHTVQWLEKTYGVKVLDITYRCDTGGKKNRKGQYVTRREATPRFKLSWKDQLNLLMPKNGKGKDFINDISKYASCCDICEKKGKFSRGHCPDCKHNKDQCKRKHANPKFKGMTKCEEFRSVGNLCCGGCVYCMHLGAWWPELTKKEYEENFGKKVKA